MALVSEGFELIVTVSDTSGSKTRKTYILTAGDFATAQTDSALILTALGNITKGVISSYQIKETFYEDALVLPTVPIAQNAEKAIMSGQLAGTPDSAPVSVPAPIEAIFGAATGPANNQVTYAAQVQAYMGIFEVGGLATVSGGQTFIAGAGQFLGGYRSTVSSRNP